MGTKQAQRTIIYLITTIIAVLTPFCTITSSKISAKTTVKIHQKTKKNLEKQTIADDEKQNTLQNGDNIKGSLEDGDFVVLSDGSVFDEYTFNGQKNKSIKITLESSDFPTILLLIDPNGNWIKKHFDLGNKKPHSSLIQISLPSNGNYRVIINGYKKEHRGKYTLSFVELNSTEPTLDNYHKFPKIESENGSPIEPKNKAERLYIQGLKQYQNRNWKQAIISWEEALFLYQKLGNKIKISFLKEAIKGLEFYFQASTYSERGEFNQALNKYQEISKLLANLQTQIERNGTVIGISPRDLALAIAGNHIDIGSVYLSQSENAKAEEQFKQGLEVYQRINYPLGQAFAYNSLGRLSFAKSEYITALKFYQQALKIELKIKTNTSGYSVLRNVAAVYSAQGKYAQALEIYQESLEVYKKLNFYLDEAGILNNIAIVYLNQGEYAKVLETYQQARDIYQKHNARSGEAATLLNIGSFYYIIGRSNEALNYYEKALNNFSEIKEIRGQASALSGIGLIKKQQGKLIESLDFYDLALTIYKKINSRSNEGYVLDSIGSLKYTQQKYEDALKDFEEGLKIAKSIENPILQRSFYNHIGLVHQEQNKYAEAFEYYQKALSISRNVEGDKFGEHQILHNIGGLNFILKQYQEGEKNLLTSIKIKESLRGSLSDINKISLIDTQLNSYSALQEVLIAQNKINQALEISERARTRAFVELLFQRITPQSQKLPSYPNLKQIQQIAKRQNATLVEYSIINSLNSGKTLLYIWLVKPTGEITFKQINLTQSLKNISLSELVINSRESIGVIGRGSSIIIEPITEINQSSNLQQLHQLLIEPIADLLPSDPNQAVIFIPQGELFLVPFPALQDQEGTYLIEKHTILTAPAIQVLDLTQKQRANVEQANLQGKVIVGNPTMPEVTIKIGEPPQQLPSLLAAETEAIEIAKLFNTQPLIGSQATKETIVSQLSQARIIHLATHGLLDDFQGSGVPGAIALAPSGNDNGLLTANEILDLKLNAELVVLSACDTGRGRITGDGVIGLSRSLITAGVPSVIVSLWSVPDAPTASLMTEFYRNWQEKEMDKAQALRQAMLTTMKTHRNPKNWAAFTLIGETE